MMFVICREGHMGFCWDGETPLFVEEGAGIFPSRADCLAYLEKYHTKEKAVDIILSLKKNMGKSILSF